MADKKMTVVFQGEDGLTPTIDNVNKSLKQTKQEIDSHATVTKKLTEAIREERQENRMRSLVLRETAGAVGIVSDAIGGPSGIGKAVQTGMGSLFEFDFALKSVAATGEGMGGSVGKLLASIGGVALPISAAIGVFALVRTALDEDEKALEKNTEAIRGYNEQLGLIPVDKAKEFADRLKKINSEAEPTVSFGTVWRGVLDNILGTTSLIEHVAASTSETDAKKKEVAVDQVKADRDDLAARLSIAETQKKILDLQVLGDVGKTNGIANLRQEVSSQEKIVAALQAQRDFAAKTNLDRETAVQKDARLLQIDLQIAQANKDLRESKKLLADVTGPMKALTPKPVKLFDEKNSGVPKKILGDFTRDARVAKKEFDSEMEDAIEGFRRETEDFNTWVAGPLLAGVDAVASAVSDGVGQAFEGVFGEANSLLEKFVEAVLQSIAQIAAQQAALAAVSGIMSLIPGVGTFSSIYSSLGGLIHFHSGGTVPRAHDGAYINSPSNREFPILVRGGETIRTEGQERNLQASRGTTVQIHLNVGTAIGGQKFVRDALSELRRQTGLSVDALTQDRSSTLRLATS